MNDTTTEAGEQLKRDIVKLTTEYWAANERAMLLALLGKELSKRYPLRDALRGQGLGTYLSSVTGVRIIRHPTNPVVVGAIPDTAPRKDAIDYFAVESAAPQIVSPLYDKGLWFAFSHPISEGHIRTVSLDPAITYRDAPITSTASPGSLIVPREFVVPKGSLPASERNQLIQAHIKSWLEQNGIEEARVIARPSQAPQKSSSLMEALISELSHEEQTRVMLPLDVVAKLIGIEKR